jgi:hypothetical protein
MRARGAEEKCKLKVRELAVKLHGEKAHSHDLWEKWSRVKQMERELESILQACTQENIGAVHAMSKKYEDLL